MDESGIVEKVLCEFQNDFEKGTPVTAEYISDYEEVYKNQLILNKRNNLEILVKTSVKVTPNLMQSEALKNLEILRDNKRNKALIISATGTGKT